MRVEFKIEAETMNYGRVNKGDIVPVSKEDGLAFIKSGIAKKMKGENKDGDSIPSIG